MKKYKYYNQNGELVYVSNRPIEELQNELRRCRSCLLKLEATMNPKLNLHIYKYKLRNGKYKKYVKSMLKIENEFKKYFYKSMCDPNNIWDCHNWLQANILYLSIFQEDLIKNKLFIIANRTKKLINIMKKALILHNIFNDNVNFI